MAWGIAAAALIGWAVTSYLALRTIDRLRRSVEKVNILAAEERRGLLDRIMYLSGNPWTPPPLPAEPPQEEVPYEDDVLDTPLPMDGAIVFIDDLIPSGRV